MIPRIARGTAMRFALLAAVAGVPIAGLATSATPALASTEANCQFRDGSAAPFGQWGDDNQYFTLLGGQFELSPASVGWLLTGGTGIVNGNEPWNAVPGTNTNSLRVPASGSATTQWFCIHPDEPTVRFFTKAPGVKGSALKVTVTAYFQAKAGSPYGGTPVTTTYTIDGSTAGWAVSPVLQLPQQAGATGAMMQVKLAATGGDWQVDDFEIDPWKSK